MRCLSQLFTITSRDNITEQSQAKVLEEQVDHCIVCDKQFTRKSSYLRHVSLVHGNRHLRPLDSDFVLSSGTKKAAIQTFCCTAN